MPETRPMPADLLLLGRRKPGMIPLVALRVIYEDPIGPQPGNGPPRCRPPLPGSSSATATPSSPPPSTPTPNPHVAGTGVTVGVRRAGARVETVRSGCRRDQRAVSDVHPGQGSGHFGKGGP